MMQPRVILRTLATFEGRPLRVAVLLFCLTTLFFVTTSSTLVSAREPAPKKVPLPGPSDAPVKTVKVPQPADFKSTHFLLHTDLPSKDAHDLLNRLETMLKLIANYWGHPPLGTIECYVVKDLGCWPEGTLPVQGRAKIQQGRGRHPGRNAQSRQPNRGGQGRRLCHGRSWYPAARSGARLLRSNVWQDGSAVVLRGHGRDGPVLASRRRQRPLPRLHDQVHPLGAAQAARRNPGRGRHAAAGQAGGV